MWTIVRGRIGTRIVDDKTNAIIANYISDRDAERIIRAVQSYKPLIEALEALINEAQLPTPRFNEREGLIIIGKALMALETAKARVKV